ncbi:MULTISPECIES: hypothetical protein [Nonomuraea]|nr:hypothetical protein [Nonomuraea ceibae]
MISYVTGDATHPHGQGPKVISHVCNDVGSRKPATERGIAVTVYDLP